MSGEGRAANLPWPQGLRETSLRLKWHQQLSALEPGLSLKAIAARFSEPYASVASWAKYFNYPFIKQSRGRKSRVDWNALDWSRKNSILARQLGVTGERVRQMRKALKLPPTQRHSDGGILFRQFIARRRRSLHTMSIRQIISESGADISTATAHTILRKAGVFLRQHFIPWEHVEWRLPDGDLARVWGTTTTYVSRVRHQNKARAAQWDGHPSINEADPTYRRLISKELKRARTERRQG